MYDYGIERDAPGVMDDMCPNCDHTQRRVTEDEPCEECGYYPPALLGFDDEDAWRDR